MPDVVGISFRCKQGFPVRCPELRVSGVVGRAFQAWGSMSVAVGQSG